MPESARPTLSIRLSPTDAHPIKAFLEASQSAAATDFEAKKGEPGLRILLLGDRDYCAVIDPPVPGSIVERLRAHLNKAAWVVFPHRTPVKRRLAALSTAKVEAAAETPATVKPAPSAPVTPAAAALDLNAGLRGAAPLFLLPDGTFAEQAAGPSPKGLAAANVLLTAARWVSSRRTSTFERLFPPSAFHPDVPVRSERLSAAQAERLLAQLEGAAAEAAVGGAAAQADADAAAQVRSAVLTVLSHILGTVRRDPSFRTVANHAAERIFAMVEAERGHATARPALRSHGIQLLQLRGPALTPEHQKKAKALLSTLIRESPPYAELKGPWRFAMCSAWDFHEGECELLTSRFGWKEIPSPTGSPQPPSGTSYRVFEAPYKNPSGDPIYLYARTATPRNENAEMGLAAFTGLLINRHAQLGSFDMQASTQSVQQVGYKLLMNSQCAGLTTRFAIAKMFPDADIYSSWDSTYFRTDPKTSKINDSEGLDCFNALLEGMHRGETHAQMSTRMQRAQWYHAQGQHPDFYQFVGPAHPLVTARYSDVNQDGRADYYDGFLDLRLANIQTDMQNSAMPRDPKVAASQIGGDAAKGLGWAVGSLNRVTQYSDLWRDLPGDSELFYIFAAGGFYSQREPPRDIPVSADTVGEELGKLPVVCRYQPGSGPGEPALQAEVMMHSYLSHAAWELKRLLCAAEAHRRALDLGYLRREGLLKTPLGQRGALLLTLAGLLEYPADQNLIDGLWTTALKMLNLPPISRSLVRGCITSEDHDASNYYGSLRGLKQLIGDGSKPGDLLRADAVAFEKLKSSDAQIGRAMPLAITDP